MARMTADPGLVQTGPPLVSRGASLFSGSYRAQWGPVAPPTPLDAAPVVQVQTKAQRSGGGLGAFVSSLGRIKMVTPNVAPREIVPGAPQLTDVQNNPPWWNPRVVWWKPAPAFARKLRTFSDNPLPVPSLQAASSTPIAQNPARLGGQRVTRWPNPQTNWPTFGPGGT